VANREVLAFDLTGHARRKITGKTSGGDDAYVSDGPVRHRPKQP
jgi:hypothetical protein